jgi:type VI secretion system secreted protein VgrG
MALTQTEQLISITTPLGADKLLLRSIRGEERISGLFQFFLEMQSEEKSLDFSKIVGKPATVAMKLADGTTRYVNGIVGRFVQAGSDAKLATYLGRRISSAPWGARW